MPHLLLATGMVRRNQSPLEQILIQSLTLWHCYYWVAQGVLEYADELSMLLEKLNQSSPDFWVSIDFLFCKTRNSDDTTLYLLSFSFHYLSSYRSLVTPSFGVMKLNHLDIK